jgi:hypothetical protein
VSLSLDALIDAMKPVILKATLYVALLVGVFLSACLEDRDVRADESRISGGPRRLDGLVVRAAGHSHSYAGNRVPESDTARWCPRWFAFADASRRSCTLH